MPVEIAYTSITWIICGLKYSEALKSNFLNQLNTMCDEWN